MAYRGVRETYEEKDGFVLVPKEDYSKMNSALLTISVLGVESRDNINEALDALDYCHKVARNALGMKTKEVSLVETNTWIKRQRNE